MQFLDLVPSVHSQPRRWTIRSVRAKDIHEVKMLNVSFLCCEGFVMTGSVAWKQV